MSLTILKFFKLMSCEVITSQSAVSVMNSVCGKYLPSIWWWMPSSRGVAFMIELRHESWPWRKNHGCWWSLEKSRYHHRVCFPRRRTSALCFILSASPDFSRGTSVIPDWAGLEFNFLLSNEKEPSLPERNHEWGDKGERAKNRGEGKKSVWCAARDEKVQVEGMWESKREC